MIDRAKKIWFTRFELAELLQMAPEQIDLYRRRFNDAASIERAGPGGVLEIHGPTFITHYIGHRISQAVRK